MLKKQLNVSVNQSLLKTVDKSVILTEIIIAMIVNVHIDWFNYFAFNSLTDLTPLIMFFILTLLHTVSEIGMYGLLHILTCWLYKVHKHHLFDFFIKLHSQNIWDKLQFSREIVLYGKSSISIFQQIFTSTDKTFILGEGLSII